jgi:hypothetical protein
MSMLILFNGRIVTNDPAVPRAGALAIDHGKVIATGSEDKILAAFGDRSEKEDLHGLTVWPGLTDAHIHLDLYAAGLAMVDCEVDHRAEVLRRIAERARATPPGEWIRGHGWNQNLWPEGFGSAADLDAVAPNHPVYLTAKSLHASWANSAALRLAGVTSATPNPANGQILRDPHGLPSGILLEDAMALVENVIPPMTAEQLTHPLRQAQPNLWKFGLTGVHDFSQTTCFSALQILDLSGELRLRVVKSIPLPHLSEAARLGLRSGYGSAFLRIGSVKLFSDGALGPHTAAMLQPYEDDPTNHGLLFLDHEQILEYGQTASQAGLSMAIHAIGDRANHETLLAYTQLRQFEAAQSLSHPRHRIEHVQCTHPADLKRLADLDIIASVQPIHATSDMDMADRYWGQRCNGAYPFHSLLSAGTHIAFGSDAPVESPNPFLGIHAAVTRRRPNGYPNADGWHPEQRISLEQALAGYTSGPAFAAGLENSLGRLAPGYAADLIVLSVDPESIPPQDLYTIQPLATMVAGQWVWRQSW